MGLDAKLTIRINNNERSIDLRKVYAVHNILVPGKGFVVGQVLLDDEMVKDLLGKLTDFMMKTTEDTRRLAAKYPNGFNYYSLPADEMQAYRNHCEVDVVIDVINLFKEIIPSKGDDVLVVYAFDS